MPRLYLKQGRKSYKKHAQEVIELAILDMNENNLSFRKASQKYDIPKTVLYRHSKGAMKKQGGQTVLSEEEENMIMNILNTCSQWGYPLDCYDLRLIIKNYLDKLGRNVTRFKDNMPGKDFVYSFLKRNKDKISLRFCENIKRSRANVSTQAIHEYFDNLGECLQGVPPCNIINYDETNLSDDVGKKKVITRRSCKHPERVMNTTKSSTSIMFAASGDGKLLPAYVCYKAQHIYSTWGIGGPKETRYNRTPSGWFDMNTFEDWVYTVALPYLKKLDGRKILLGDNLASHISVDLVKNLQNHNIEMVFLPPNSTHLTQPLDLAFFRPLKIAWREILLLWKKGEGRKECSIPKSLFPGLIDAITPNSQKNILSGFRKGGIVPLNRDEVLQCLPPDNMPIGDAEVAAANNSVVDLLKEMRYTETPQRKPRKSKLAVAPGKSVTFESSESSDSEIAEIENDSESSDSVVEDGGSILEDDEEMIPTTSKTRTPSPHDAPTLCDTLCKNNIKKDDWVIVKFPVENKKANIKQRVFIGKILKTNGEHFEATFLRKKPDTLDKNKAHTYAFPNVQDITEFNFDQIIKKLVKFTERRGCYTFNNTNTQEYENI